MNASLTYKRGDTNPIQMTPDPGAPIVPGNLLFRDPNTKNARTASSMNNQGSANLNQDVFKQLFVGVALQRGGELEPGEVSFNLNPLPPQIVVATAGEFEFSCATATTWYPGDLVAIAANTGGTALLDQFVVKVTNPQVAIGIAVPEANAVGQSRTTVVVRIEPVLTSISQLEATSGSSSSSGV